MSHLLQADRMAEERWHVPHGGEGKLNVWEVERDRYQSALLFMRDVQLAVFKT